MTGHCSDYCPFAACKDCPFKGGELSGRKEACNPRVATPRTSD